MSLGAARKVLHWLGVENEHSLFSWRWALLVAGAVAFLRYPSGWTAIFWLSGVALNLWESIASAIRTRMAMQTAHEQAIARLEAEADVVAEQVRAGAQAPTKELLARMEAVEKATKEMQGSLKLLATPEKFAELQELMKKRLGVKG